MRLFRKPTDELAWSVVGACAAIYLLSAGLSMVAAPAGEPWVRFLFEPSQETLVDMGMGGSLPLHQLNIWSLITSTYLHLDILHIVLNALCLFAFFPVVSQQYGKAKTFVIYTAAGIAGALLSAATGEMYSLGASGGVLGLYGAMVAYGFRSDDPARWAPVKAELLWVLANFAFGVTLSENISNAGHLGGLIGGLAAGLVLGPAKGETTPFFRSKAALACMALVGVFLAVNLSQGAWATYLAAENRSAYDARLTARRAAELDEKIRQSPNDAAAFSARGNQRFSMNDWTGALQDFEAAAAIDPSSANLYSKASALYNLRRYDDAIKLYDTILDREPTDIGSLFYRAGAQQQKSDTQAAMRDYREIIKIDPTDAMGYMMRATAFKILDDLDEAVKDYDLSLELAPQEASTYLARAGAYIMMQQYEKAIEDYTSAIDYGIKDAEAWNGRAWAYFNLGRQQEGLVDVEHSLSMAPDYMAAIGTRAHILEAMGEREKAIAGYRTVLEKDPTSSTSREGLQRLGAF